MSLATQAAAPPRGLDETASRDICDRVLRLSRADHCRVNLDSGWRGFTRVATNRITTAGGSNDVTVRIMSVFGRRVASVTTNIIDAASIEAAVRRSEQLARLAPADPEYLPELGAQTYAPTNAYYEATGELTPAARAEAARLAIESARARDFVAAGYIDARAGARAVATSAGLFAFHRSTGVASTLTVRTPDGSSSGWAGDEAADWNNIASRRIATDAVAICADWRGKTALAPGRYTAVLQPTAVGMLLQRMTGAFDARAAAEGRSYFSKPGGGDRIGERLFHRFVSITSDPARADAETSPFAADGQPVGPETWIENGFLRGLSASRYWAGREGVAAKPAPSNLIMRGGSTNVEEMIASVERGVLITRFWYIRPLDPRRLAYTGLTRDGTFLIEDGRVARPVNNFRFNQSLADLFQNVRARGRATRVAAGENSSVGTPIVAPPLLVGDFNLASVSDAI